MADPAGERAAAWTAYLSAAAALSAAAREEQGLREADAPQAERFEAKLRVQQAGYALEEAYGRWSALREESPDVAQELARHPGAG